MPDELLASPRLSDNPHVEFLRSRYGLLLCNSVNRGLPRDDAERAEHERIVAEMDGILSEIDRLECGQ
jgi:hypothetical protein